ncbi:MAG: hypothetical protein AABY16_01900 [Nanoarchaeota archaeon]
MSPKKRHKTLIIKIILLCAVVLVCLIVLEVFLRFYLSKYPRGVRDYEGRGLFIVDNKLGYKMKPNFVGFFRNPEFDTSWKTNSDGYRNFEFNIDDQNIILMLGDSFMVGHGVEENQTVSYLLNQKLEEYVVYNLGVQGYSEKQYLEQLKTMLPEYSIKLAVINFYLGNDIQENCGIIERGVSAEGAHIKQENDGAWRKLKSLLKKSEAVLFIYRNVVQLFKVDVRYASFYLEKYESEGNLACYNKTREYLSEIKPLAEKHNVPLIIFLIGPEELTDKKKVEMLYKRHGKFELRKINLNVLSMCEELSTECFDLTDYFENSEGLYISNHWNIKGNELAALEIENYLRSRGLI